MNFERKAVPLLARGRKHSERMWINWLWVGLGGFAGSVLRYGAGIGVAALVSFLRGGTSGGGRFPIATLAVNVVGSFLIGLLLRYAEQGSVQHLAGVVGFCGGFTTFSTFSLESVRLIRDGHLAAAFLYIGLSFLLCLGATFWGMTIKINR